MFDIIYGVIIIFILHYTAFLLRVLYGLLKERKETESKKEYSVSIIIPFRNESQNILNNLQRLEAQNYPKEKFEVKYVDDSSTDDSLEKIQNAKKSANIQVLSVPKVYSEKAHKKRAINYGIENSNSDVIITSDADCIYDNDWLKSMMKEFDEDTAFVSGPVVFKVGNKLFDKLQKLEFAGLVLVGAGLIGAGSPIICNAANLGYKRSVFFEVKGFSEQMGLTSGDDELLMQKIKKDTNYKIKFCTNKSAVVETHANKSYSQFYQQRKRWASKGLFYADKFLILKLILIFLFYLSIPVQVVLAFFSVNKFLPLLVISVSFKIFLEYLILKEGEEFLKIKEEMKYFIFAEIFQIPYIIIAAVSGIFGNYKWKERTVKR